MKADSLESSIRRLKFGYFPATEGAPESVEPTEGTSNGSISADQDLETMQSNAEDLAQQLSQLEQQLEEVVESDGWFIAVLNVILSDDDVFP